MHTDSEFAARGSILLPIARASISNTLGRFMQVDEQAGWLQEQGACFVTLTQRGDLRGCIGTLDAHRTLLQDVKANARAAAFHDPRFKPLTLAELDITEIELSLLSTIQPLQFSSEPDALKQMKPGVHGVVFEYAHHRSTFLPQVWEQLPGVAEFMAQLKYKAGLPPDFWAEKVAVSIYTVSKWNENALRETTAVSK